MKNLLFKGNLTEYIKNGPENLITDVPGVKVGHYTLKSEKNSTGVTAIIPAEGNLFKKKLVASAHIINGFGKSTGLLQIQELGTLETPIILTNTLSVGTAYSALTKYMLYENTDIGDTTGTVNPVVCECNDSKINDIRSMVITENNIFQALKNPVKTFQQGDVGAGTGMICYDLKGGIGSASKVIQIENQTYTLGILVLSNFGSIEDLVYNDNHIGKKIKTKIGSSSEPDKGSIIVVLATNLPMDSRQINRLLKRTQSGIARTGSYTGNGSGEIAVGFSTSNRINHYPHSHLTERSIFHEDFMDIAFLATVQATEEAIHNSLIHSNPSRKRDGVKVHTLSEFL